MANPSMPSGPSDQVGGRREEGASSCSLSSASPCSLSSVSPCSLSSVSSCSSPPTSRGLSAGSSKNHDNPKSSDPLWVVVGFIERGDDILIAKRPAHVDQGNVWEFPGGKREENETAEAALVRELKEEVGIDVHQAESCFQLEHAYPNKTVFLDCYRVTEFSGEPEGCEGQPVQWVPKSTLRDYEFPAGNAQMIDWLL